MRAILLVLALALGSTSALAAEDGAPYYPDHPLTREELAGKSLRELDLMRNTIYARVGNVFRKAWLRDYFTQQPWYKPTGLDASKLSEQDKQNAATIAEYTLSIPRPELQKRLRALNAKGDKATTEDRTELSLLRRALGGEGGAADSNPLDNPTLLDKPITAEMLKDMSGRDLRLLRNLIYARRGRPFKDKELREYFQRMEWYKPDPKFTEARLTRLDHRNLTVVKGVEDEVNMPFDKGQIFGAA